MVTLKTLCANYLHENFWLADSTKETTERAFRWLAESGGNLEIDRLKFEHIAAYKKWLIVTGRNKNTANIYLRALAPVFKWAVNLGLIGLDPTSGVQQFRITQRPIRVYSDWELRKMIAVAKPRWKAILLCAWTTGLRRGEILNLTRDNVRNGFVFVEPKRETKNGWLWEPKDKEIRKVPLVQPLKEMLDEIDGYYLMLSPTRYKHLMRLKAAGLLGNRQRRCPEENFRRTFVSIQRRVFGRQIGDFHSIRKTFATNMLDAGSPQHLVQRMLGHSDARTMLTYYTGCNEVAYEDARQCVLNIVMGRVPGSQLAERRRTEGTPPNRGDRIRTYGLLLPKQVVR